MKNTVHKPLLIPQNAIEFDKIYKVMDLRLAHGYSQYELSWLLGYRDFYVRDVENPTHKLRYDPNDTNYLQHIFNCGADKIIAPRIIPARWQVCIEEIPDKQQYRIYRMEKGKRKRYRTLQTEDKWIRYRPLHKTMEAADLNGFIRNLLQTGYFSEPRTQLDIFGECQQAFGEMLRPLQVIEVIQGISRQHSHPKLMKGVPTGTGRTTWVITRSSERDMRPGFI